MKTESGMQKNIGNFEALIAHCGTLEKYNPGNQDLSVNNLNVVLAQAQETMDQEIEAKKTFQDVTNFRAAEFEGIGQLSGRVINVLVSNNATEAKVEDANEHHRKLNGRRADNSKPTEATDNEATTENEAGSGRHSVSQLSYDNRIGHFTRLIATILKEPAYVTNEPDLSIPGLQAKLEGLQDHNRKVKDMEAVWKQRLIARNEAFNNDRNGLVHIASLVKSYIKSIYSANSPQYDQLAGLPFKKVI